jgi:hypothetical protein
MMLSIALGTGLESSAQVFGFVMFFHMRLLAEMRRSGLLQIDLKASNQLNFCP